MNLPKATYHFILFLFTSTLKNLLICIILSPITKNLEVLKTTFQEYSIKNYLSEVEICHKLPYFGSAWHTVDS